MRHVFRYCIFRRSGFIKVFCACFLLHTKDYKSIYKYKLAAHRAHP